MNDIDRKIRAALSHHAGDTLQPDEPNLSAEVIAVFKNQQRWFTILTFALGCLFFAGFVWACLLFHRADTVSLKLQWGGIALVLLQLQMLMKLWFWLEMHTNRILRELKRVELNFVTRTPHS